MIENVTQRVPEEFTHAVCFEDYIFERMSRQLADRVLNKILEGECICKFVEKSITEEWCTDQIEYRMGVDIQPLVRCKDCCNREYKVYDDGSFYCGVHKRYFPDLNYFCADGKEIANATLA